MIPRIRLQKIWEDSDLTELNITANDGINTFSVRIYAAHEEFDDIYNSLSLFKNQYYGGVTEINFGEFGQKYANGCFYARLNFTENQHGKIFISIRMQSDFYTFGSQQVASEANLYLITEPALLDNFINGFRDMDKDINSDITLVCLNQ